MKKRQRTAKGSARARAQKLDRATFAWLLERLDDVRDTATALVDELRVMRDPKDTPTILWLHKAENVSPRVMRKLRRAKR